MKRFILGVTTLLVLAAPATAASLKATDCVDDDATANVRNLSEPWEKNSKTFSNGNIRVALLDTGGEPVCCSQHVVVTYPGPPDPDSGFDEMANCSIVDPASMQGFNVVMIDKLTATYDPKKGLLVTFPYELYNEGNDQKVVTGKFLINSKTGKLTPL